MVYANTQDVPSGTDFCRRIIDALGPEPLVGQLLHFCLRRPNGFLSYLEVWESEQDRTQAFDERIHPAIDATFGGRHPSSEPEVQRLDVLHASGSLLEPTWS